MPIGERDALSKDEIALAQACTEAMDLYFSREWEAAAAAFAAILKQKPDDEPAKIMRDRCKAFAQSPPPADWDGLSQTEKR